MAEIEFNPFDKSSVAAALEEIKKQKAWMLEKEKELRLRLATIGATVASIRFSRAFYDGVKDVTVRVTDRGKTAVIYANGKSVAFIEFGSGAKYGSGHPMGSQFGFAPGSWSTTYGSGHWDDPNGWYYAPNQKSWGNPPAMAMVAARDEILAQFTTIAKEVFASD